MTTINETKKKDKKGAAKPKKKTGGSKKKATPKPTKNPKPEAVKDEDGYLPEEKMSRKEVYQFVLGTVLMLVALFVAGSIVSYLWTGREDQSLISEGFAQTGIRAHNYMGKLGAYVSDYLVNQKFGLSSILIPVFLFMAGVRVMALFKVRLWKWFINCGMLMTWLSTLGASIYTSMLQESNLHFHPGGDFGRMVVDQLDDKLGPAGRWIVVIAMAVAYLCYLSTETIRILKRSMQKPVTLLKDHLTTEGDGNGEENDNEPLVDTETGEIITGDGTEAQDQPGAEEDAMPAPLIDNDVFTPQQDTATIIEFHEPDEQPKEDTPAATATATVDDDMEIVIATDEEPAQEVNPEAASTPSVIESAEATITVGSEPEKADPQGLAALEPYDPKLDLENYRYPTLDLLKKYAIDRNSINIEEHNQNKQHIKEVLSNFGVEISTIKATVGPTITLYEITPAPGVRISKIRNLEDDIALSLSAMGIRIIAPIPGKGTIGIEVPNAKPQMVSMESIINSKKFQETDYELPMALGKTITNDVFMVDLAKMPHLLVAGATGQGKSVGLNAIITSLLYKKHPAELKLVMVDPKKVEFSVYNPIVNHFLAQVEGNEDEEEPIITDVNKVVQTLKSLCQEMDTRYDLLKKARVRNVKEYNQKFKDRHLNPENGHKFMPYIVVVIDEFGDLIMTAGKEIELPIARIAQLARAVGIHMIIATQRPTTNIITGTIKANFPARMAFRVGAMVDSRTILDRTGANQLVGKGDMLFLSGTEPVRVQCAFVDTPEVERICNHIACQQSYNAPFPLPMVAMEGDEEGAPDVDLQHLDPMFEEVARLVVAQQSGSTSMIQRKFSIGYNRAGRLMDQLEVAGIVGPAHGSKPREVLCISDDDLQFRLDNLR